MQHLSTVGSRAPAFRRRAAALAIASLFTASGAVEAFEIDTGNPDIAMRWDNTVRYNLGVRAQSQNNAILGNPNFDDGDRNFSNGSVVTNRLDLLSEFDFVYQRKVRLSRELCRRGGISPTTASTTPTPRPRIRWSTDCRSPAR